MRVAAFTLAYLLAACASQQGERAPIREAGNPEITAATQPQLVEGLHWYETGDFRRAQRALRSSLDAGLTAADEISARKHLAFIYCMSARERLCREEFKRVLALNPNFELALAEAGHPQWGPVFRDLKGKP